MDAEAKRDTICCELVHHAACSFGEVRLKVTGSSMLPVIWPGDEITVVISPYAGLQAGQIVLYHRNGRLTAHRIERVTEDHLIARGDSLALSDSPVLPEEVVGQVVSILRNGCNIRSERSAISYIVSLLLQRSQCLRRIAVYLIRHLTNIMTKLYRVPEICG